MKNLPLLFSLALIVLVFTNCKKEQSPEEICRENLIGEFESTSVVINGFDYSLTYTFFIEFDRDGKFNLNINGQKAEGDWDIQGDGDMDLDFDIEKSTFYLPGSNCEFDCSDEIELRFTTTEPDGSQPLWIVDLEKQ